MAIDPTPSRKQIITFPTPNIADRILHERHDALQKAYVVPGYGTAHPNTTKYAGFVLSYVKSADETGQVDWYYLNTRANQDDYNFEVEYPYADTSYPRVIRTYVLLRSSFTEIAAGSTDPVYVSPPLILLEHKVTRLSDPTLDSLFIAVQRAYERLPGPVINSFRHRTGTTIEKATEQKVPASDTLASGTAILAEVIIGKTTVESDHITKTLVDGSGTLVTSDTGYTTAQIDNRTQVVIYTTHLIRAAATLLPTVGSAFGADGNQGYVIDGETVEIPDSPNVIQKVVWCAAPPARVEYPNIGYRFPALFTFNDQYYISTSYAGQEKPPWPGDGVTPATFHLLAHRQLASPARVSYTYSLGPSGKIPPVFVVKTPGVSSKHHNIPPDTLHNKILWTELVGGSLFLVENIEPSTPALSDYSPANILIAAAEEVQWKGNFYEKRITEVSETTSPYDFPPLSRQYSFQATTAADILAQPITTGELLYLRSTNAGDTMYAWVYGLRTGATTFTYERVTLAGLTQKTTAQHWTKITQLRLASGPAGTVSLRKGGSKASGAADLATMPADGDTFTIGKTGFTRTYTYRANAVSTLTILASAALAQGSYFDVVVSGSTICRYWFDKDAAGTGAPSNPGTLTKIPIVTGGTAAQNAASLQSHAATSGFGMAVASATVVLFATKFGTITFTDGTTATGITRATNTAGTADAPNLIMVDSPNDIAGWFSLSNVAEGIAEAINGTGPGVGLYWGTGTTAHADLTSAWTSTEPTHGLVTFAGLVPYNDGATWVTSQTGTGLSITAVTPGVDGTTLASIAPAATQAYSDIHFNNSDGANGTALLNMPALLTVNTDAVSIPAGKQVVLVIRVADQPNIAISYQWSNDNVTYGSLNNIGPFGDGSLNFVPIGYGGIYLRLHVINAGTSPRGIYIEYDYTS